MMQRRGLLKGAAVLVLAGLLKPVAALAAWNKAAFSSKTSADALKSLGTPSAEASGGIVIEAPQIAENGAVVPIEVTSNIPGTTSLAVLVEKNPYPLVAKFDFMEARCPSSRSTPRWARLPTCAWWPRRAASITRPPRRSK